jgi:hypothetical protein
VLDGFSGFAVGTQSLVVGFENVLSA